MAKFKFTKEASHHLSEMDNYRIFKPCIFSLVFCSMVLCDQALSH